MRKTTGNSASQQILLEHSLSINQKKKKKRKIFTYQVQKKQVQQKHVLLLS